MGLVGYDWEPLGVDLATQDQPAFQRHATVSLLGRSIRGRFNGSSACSTQRPLRLNEVLPMRIRWLSVVIVATFCGRLASAQELAPVAVEGQPLAANVRRLLQALDYLGAPLPADTQKALQAACDARDAEKIQRLLDPHVLLAV